MSGLVAVLGGQEHQPGCELIDRRLLAESGLSHPTVAVLLAATVPSRIGAKIAEATTYWHRLGARTTIGFADAGRDIEDALDALRAPDLVVLTGGRPWVLHRHVTAPVVARIRQLHADGVPLSGSSAGAMALASRRLHLQPGHAPRLVAGLGFVPGAAAPHFGRRVTRESARLIARHRPDLTVLGLPDRTALVGRGGTFEVVGAGYCTILCGDSRRRHRPGAVIELTDPCRTPRTSQRVTRTGSLALQGARG